MCRRCSNAESAESNDWSRGVNSRRFSSTTITTRSGRDRGGLSRRLRDFSRWETPMGNPIGVEGRLRLTVHCRKPSKQGKARKRKRENRGGILWKEVCTSPDKPDALILAAGHRPSAAVQGPTLNARQGKQKKKKRKKMDLERRQQRNKKTTTKEKGSIGYRRSLCPD